MALAILQSQPSARILIWAAEGISAFNVAHVINLHLGFTIFMNITAQQVW